MKSIGKISLVLLTTVLLGACKSDSGQDADVELTRAVKTLETKVSPIRISRYFPATLEPPELVPLAFEVGGRIAEIDLRVGQRVAKGDLLGTIEPVNLELQLRKAKATLLEIQTLADNAHIEARRYKKLFERGAGSAAARDRALAEYNQANARLKQAQANVDLLSESRSDAELLAPFDGYINSVDVQGFASVKAGEPVLTLYREGHLQATVLASFKVVESLSVGDNVTILSSEEIAQPIESWISEIGQRAVAVSSFPVVVTLKNATSLLRPGLAVEVKIELEPDQAPGQIKLPLSSIVTHASTQFGVKPPYDANVYVFKPENESFGTLEKRKVKLIAASGHSVFVSEGLSPGERVVTAGVPFLKNGQKVKLLQSELERGNHP